MGERAYTLSSYFVSPLFCIYSFVVSGFPCLLFLVPVAVLSLLRYLLRAIERSLFALQARLPRFCGYCFFITDDLTLFRYSSYHIGKLICLPRNALAV